jgi:DNA-binding MarR family transcriptional regulator
MHAIFFGLKRAHHGALRITRDVLARMGLTAARFDMLYALQSQRRAGMLQSEVRRILGVCRATASRMLASLEELGLVKREPYPHDRRQRLVLLTERGRERIGYAHQQMIGSGWAQLAVDSALGGTHWYDKKECLAATLLVDGVLDRVRRAFSTARGSPTPGARTELARRTRSSTR